MKSRRQYLADHGYEDETGCWIWEAALNENGYGQAYWNGEQGLAHRWSFEEFNGPIPPGLQVNHKCHVRACFHPHHLKLGTAKTNAADSFPPIKRNLPPMAIVKLCAELAELERTIQERQERHVAAMSDPRRWRRNGSAEKGASE
jgi:hypothetical protein